MIDSEEAACRYVANLTDAASFAKLETYTAMLLIEAEQQNLIARASFDAVWQRHIADSMQLLAHVPRGTGRLADFGTGAGLPGIVLAIAAPDTEVHCYESRTKRVAWLEQCVDKLQLANCHIHHGQVQRADAISAHCLTARAFAPIDKLLRLTTRFAAKNAVWVLPRGRSAWQDSEAARRAGFVFHVEQSITQGDAGILVGGRARL